MYVEVPNSSFYLPLIHLSGFASESSTDPDNCSLIHGKWEGILFLFDLIQRFICCGIKFQLDDVDIIIGLHNYIHPAIAGVALCLQGLQYPHRGCHEVLVP